MVMVTVMVMVMVKVMVMVMVTVPVRVICNWGYGGSYFQTLHISNPDPPLDSRIQIPWSYRVRPGFSG